MLNKELFQNTSSTTSILYRMSPSISTRPRSFFSQFVMTITVIVLLIAFSPCVSSSPTPSSAPIQHNNNNNKINYDSNGFMFDPNDYQTTLREDPSLLSSAIHQEPSSSSSSSFWYAQPRTHANQFLMSHVNDNQIIVPKWFTRLNNNNNDDDDDDDDDIDDYVPSSITVNKRSSFINTGGYPILKKRKQLTKPPMEVMNEIVNSIYLKR